MTTTQSKHTPGPWEWIAGKLVHRVKRKGDQVVAFAAGGEPGPFIFCMNNADEALIAAAPKLLDALRRIREARDHYASSGEYPAGCSLRDESHACFDDWAADIADAAIAKAEGRAS